MSLSETSWFADITTLNIKPNRGGQSTLASIAHLALLKKILTFKLGVIVVWPSDS